MNELNKEKKAIVYKLRKIKALENKMLNYNNINWVIYYDSFLFLKNYLQ